MLSVGKLLMSFLMIRFKGMALLIILLAIVYIIVGITLINNKRR
jgi:ABC-type branched-subunit amino acid transport system permease subunit